MPSSSRSSAPRSPKGAGSGGSVGGKPGGRSARSASKAAARSGTFETVNIERLVAGGDGLGRLADGRVVFVSGVAAGETVKIELTMNKKDLARGEIAGISSASADRVTPLCDRVAAGCGGCSWQHLSRPAQLSAKAELVREAFRRLGKLPEVADKVRSGGSVGGDDGSGWRTTVRAAVNANGEPGFRHRASHDVCVSGACMVAHPVIGAILAGGLFPGTDEVFIRVGIASRSVVVGVNGRVSDVEMPSLDEVPGGPWKLMMMGDGDADKGINETIAGVDFTVSSGSFFQSGAEAASLLVTTVGAMLEQFEVPDVFVDLYGGVGLFAATVGKSARSVMVIEESETAVDDAQLNLPPSALIHRKRVEEWDPPRMVRRASRVHVVADPARAGLGVPGVEAVLRAAPDVVVLVSCDSAAAARDMRLLVNAGFECRDAAVLDLFPHTHHVEVVSLLVATQATRLVAPVSAD
jgi:tRNA/tmRNA/rRNA uracil-C5-methylase (TrmA/RlmC/RlmD family)